MLADDMELVEAPVVLKKAAGPKPIPTVAAQPTVHPPMQRLEHIMMQ